MSHAELCPVCKGVGHADLQQICKGCGGRGWVTVKDEAGGSWPRYPYPQPCCPLPWYLSPMITYTTSGTGK